MFLPFFFRGYRLFVIPWRTFNISIKPIGWPFYRLISFVMCLLFVSISSAKEDNLDAISANLSALDLIKQAESLKSTNTEKSSQLAQRAIVLSKETNDEVAQARSYFLLGSVTKKNSNTDQTADYFLQASLIYKNLGDTRKYLMSSIDYIKILITQEKFDAASEASNRLLKFVLDHEEMLPIGLVYIVKGDAAYEQKKYQKSIGYYNQALPYLSSDDKKVKRHLGTTYKKIAQAYKRLKNRKQTVMSYENALKVFSDINSKKNIARTLNTLAEAERHLGNYFKALDYSTRGLKIHETIDDSEGFAKASMGAGIIYRYIKRYDKSLEHVYDAFVHYKEVNNISGIAKTSNEMGHLYIRVGEFEQAKSFFEETINLPRKNIDKMTLASALREMAVIEYQSNNLQAAKIYAEQAAKTYSEQDNKPMSSVANRIIGNIYNAQHDEVSAINYYRKSLSYANQADSILHQIKTLTPLAKLLIGKDNEESLRLLKKSLKQSIEIGSKEHQLYAYQALRKVEKEKGNIAQALSYAEEEIALTFILQNEAEDKQLILAKANLYSHKKEMELESLREALRQDQLEIARKNNEILMSEKTRATSELELVKNKFANIALACLLVISVLVMFLIYRRFSLSKKRNKELDYLASRDPLTNCFNRRVLFDLMNKYFADKNSLDEFCAIMIDVDHFKRINDTYGHGFGDTVLSGVAKVLQENVRQDDIVCRFGGEEFCILLHRISQEQAMKIAKTMCHEVESKYWGETKVTCSFGVSSIRFGAENPSELIAQADMALYRSKSLGRNQVSLWSKALEEESKEAK